jgi:hypothetical protein
MNSRVVLPALQQAMSALISDARASGELQQFGINYSGHGDPNGMFEGALDPEDDEAFLAHVVAELGHRIDLLDWGSNCNVATYENLSNQAAYADYIVASDLALACTVHNGDYTALVQPGQPFRDTVLRALAVDEAHYGNQAELIRERNFSESVHAFDARRFVDLAAHADLDAADDKTMLAGNEDCAHFYNGGKNRVGDVLCYLRKHAPGRDGDLRVHAFRVRGLSRVPLEPRVRRGERPHPVEVALGLTPQRPPPPGRAGSVALRAPPPLAVGGCFPQRCRSYGSYQP